MAATPRATPCWRSTLRTLVSGFRSMMHPLAFVSMEILVIHGTERCLTSIYVPGKTLRVWCTAPDHHVFVSLTIAPSMSGPPTHRLQDRGDASLPRPFGCRWKRGLCHPRTGGYLPRSSLLSSLPLSLFLSFLPLILPSLSPLLSRSPLFCFSFSQPTSPFLSCLYPSSCWPSCYV